MNWVEAYGFAYDLDEIYRFNYNDNDKKTYIYFKCTNNSQTINDPKRELFDALNKRISEIIFNRQLNGIINDEKT